MNLVLIAAIGKNYELGKDNDLIWHLPSDLKFFRKTTKEHTIVMGRKTFESLPGMLPKRHHIVLSRQTLNLPEEVDVMTLDMFLDKYKDSDEEIFGIGGAMVYEELLPYANRLILTEINDSKPCDVYFPRFDKNRYIRNVIADVHENGVDYQHVEYVLKNSD